MPGGLHSYRFTSLSLECELCENEKQPKLFKHPHCLNQQTVINSLHRVLPEVVQKPRPCVWRQKCQIRQSIPPLLPMLTGRLQCMTSQISTAEMQMTHSAGSSQECLTVGAEDTPSGHTHRYMIRKHEKNGRCGRERNSQGGSSVSGNYRLAHDF